MPDSVSPTRLHNITVQRLALAVGRGIAESNQSSADIALAIGVHEQTVAEWKRGAQAPNGPSLVALMGFIGPPLTNRVLQLVGQTGAHIAHGEEQAAQHVLTKILEFAAELSRMLDDGHIDHAEHADLRDRAFKLVGDLAGLAERRATPRETGGRLNPKTLRAVGDDV